LDGKTIDWGRLEPQPSDDPPRAFSYLNADKGVVLKDRLIQVTVGGDVCFIIYTEGWFSSSLSLSHLTRSTHPQKKQCHKTFTTPETHKIVMDNAHLLPDYDGDGGKGVGPRYCPSLFKKASGVWVFVCAGVG
jgi:tRNA uridine 5-carboxymethylaminomethyl modification enzyme